MILERKRKKMKADFTLVSNTNLCELFDSRNEFGFALIIKKGNTDRNTLATSKTSGLTINSNAFLK
jgi:hypothetical protein